MPFHGQEPTPWEPRPLRTFTWKDWGGRPHTLQANYVNFAPEHVTFWADRESPVCDLLILAARNIQINDLKEES